MITQDELKAVLSYNPESGVFVWIKHCGPNASIGSVAGCVKRDGYVAIGINRRLYAAHRLAWVYMYGEIPAERHIDHIDRDRRNNRIGNLRLANKSQNAMNMGMMSTNSSGVKGVCFDKNRGKFMAYIGVDNKQLYLGRFASLDEARDAYEAASKKYHGDFGRVVATL